jgi:hypothetical protein
MGHFQVHSGYWQDQPAKVFSMGVPLKVPEIDGNK